MPTSYSDFKKEIGALLSERWRAVSSEGRGILDVGPGEGTYAKLLPKLTLDALEIYPPYISRFALNRLYRRVLIGDVLRTSLSEWQCIILGDVLEHLRVEDARRLISSLHDEGKEVLIALPFRLKQGSRDGNIHETHLQDDLTADVVAIRYPQLSPLFVNSRYGYYANWQHHHSVRKPAVDSHSVKTSFCPA
jgi:hypothetical protein